MAFGTRTFAGYYSGKNGIKHCLTSSEFTWINELNAQVVTNKADIAGIVAGSVSDGAITNAKLATDVKVGSLATLTTTEKASVVGALNEVDANADTANTSIGTLASLTTAVKTNLVVALNEVDAHCDTNITAIGTLASLTTTEKTNLVGAINEINAENANMVTLTGVQTLTNKTVTNLVIDDGDAGCTITSADQAAAAVITIPNCGDTADTFVLADTAQTLTLKTLTTPVIASFYQDAGKTQLMTAPNTASDTLAALAATQTFTNKTLTTPVIASFYQDAGKTQLMTAPNTASDTLAALAATQTFTNKTLTTPVIASIYQDAGKTKLMTLPDTASDTLAAIAATQTMTNKTLTTPVIASFYQDAGKTKLMTTPDTASDTLCAIAATQTLTNKTFTSPVINTPVTTDGAETYTLSPHDYSGGTADWTLSAGELLMPCHKPTNASGAVNAIVADTVRPYLFINSTGQALTVKTAAGTGITIANAKAAWVMSDGTNVIRLSTDA